MSMCGCWQCKKAKRSSLQNWLICWKPSWSTFKNAKRSFKIYAETGLLAPLGE